MSVRLKLTALALLVGACSNSKSPTPPFAFNRPERLAFVCLDPNGEQDKDLAEQFVDPPADAGVSDGGVSDGGVEAADPGPRLGPLVLPLRCCARDPLLAPDDSAYTALCGWDSDEVEPVLHALVSQSARGEVAAVDLAANQVIDTDRLVPGYTYVDVGGLPTAIVVPQAWPQGAIPDEAPPAPDAGAGTDAGTDAGADAGEADAGADGGAADAGADGGAADAGADGGAADAGADGGLDAGLDAGAPGTPPGAGEATGFTPNYDELHGPPWVYVASAEELHVRAVATCTFRPRRGQRPPCGPEAKLARKVGDDKAADLMKVPLPSEPRDMIIGPDQALWITMPGVGLIARIGLSSDWQEPFFLENGELPKPQFFAVSDLADAPPVEPMTEAPGYRAACGLGYTMGEAAPVIALPNAPRATVGDAPRPTRMHYDELSKLLLVADEAQPGVRAFALGHGKLVPVGVINTGAPVRDFVLTPEVPVQLPASMGKVLPLDPVNFSPDQTVRYLYGIDDRDGSVFVHTFGYDASGGLATTPLAPPYADRFHDRIDLPYPSAAVTLEVIDTRSLSAPACGVDIDDYKGTDGKVSAEPPDRELNILGLERTAMQADADRDADFVALEKKRKAALEAAEEAHDKNVNDTTKAALGAARLANAQTEDERGILERAGAGQLRGVFVVVAGSDGWVRVIDVLDLDTWCRAEQSCAADGTSLRENVDDPQPVATQRHARRLIMTTTLNATVSDGTALAGMTCPVGHRPLLDGNGNLTSEITEPPIICLPNDPWFAQSASVSIRYEAAFPGLVGTGTLQVSDGSTELRAPPGFDFCARGISPAKDGVITDALAVIGKPKEGVDGCPDVDPDSPMLYRIEKAFSNHLVLSAQQPLDEDDSNMDKPKPLALDKLRACYPELFDFQIWVQDEFLVTTGGLREHRTTSDLDTHECIEDPSKDPRFTMRYKGADDDASALFVNRFVAIKPKNEDHRDRNRVTNIQVVLPIGHVEGQVVDPTQTRSDSLPVTLRYFPYTGELFIVDVASQGLRRFSLSPFGTTNTTFR